MHAWGLKSNREKILKDNSGGVDGGAQWRTKSFLPTYRNRKLIQA